MKRFLDSLMSLGMPRVIGLVAVGLAALGIIGAVALHGTSQPMALLYGDLDLHDSAQITAVLDKQHVAYELKSGGGEILVPSDEVDRLRLALARESLPSGGSVGYEVFDRSDSLTSNQFQQQINQLRALEGELGRTIRTIRGVRNVRVHLVLAKREPFAREQQEAQASIVLAMAGAQRMNDEEVQAVVNLVSAAVPGLKPQNISVVDSRGELLARAGRSTGIDGAANTHDELRRAMEQRLGHEVEDMLSRTLGPGHVRATATVEMDFDRVNETQEKFDPDGQVMRNQQTVTDGSKNTEAQAAVTVQNNLPNPNPDAGTGSGSGSTTSHQEENNAYEIGKTVRTVVRDSPTVKKVSMAVLVDGVTTRADDGKQVWAELSQPDLDRIATLVKSAIGYDDKRGDHVEVVNMRFSSADDLPDTASAGAAWWQLGKADIVWLITIGVTAMVALFALLFVVRPLGLKLVSGMEAATPRLDAPVEGGQQALALATPDGQAATLLTANDGTDTMLNVPNIQGEVRASSLRKLGELVDSQPDASVTVIRGWLSQGAS